MKNFIHCALTSFQYKALYMNNYTIYDDNTKEI